MILGLGSPVAWHTNDATPPEMPVWSSGDLTKLGKPDGGKGRGGRGELRVIKWGGKEVSYREKRERGMGEGEQKGGEKGDCDVRARVSHTGI